VAYGLASAAASLSVLVALAALSAAANNAPAAAAGCSERLSRAPAESLSAADKWTLAAEMAAGMAMAAPVRFGRGLVVGRMGAAAALLCTIFCQNCTALRI
jgi:hypothetical protein